LKKSLDDCKLYATTSGMVGRRSIEPGMTATPGLASIMIIKIAKVFARVSVSESEIALVEKGAKATLKIGALGCREYAGKVEEIGVMADPLTHSYKIKIAVPHTDEMIKPGMVCSVMVHHASEAHGVVVALMCYVFVKHGVKGENSVGKKATFLKRMQVSYDKLLAVSFDHKKTVVAIGFASFVLGLVGGVAYPF
jgi:hypothetical protein